MSCNKCKITGIGMNKSNKKNKSLIEAALGGIIGGVLGVAVNQAVPDDATGTIKIVANAAKIVGGTLLAFNGKGQTAVMTAGIGLAGEGGSELAAMFLKDTPDTYSPPKIFGVPAHNGIYTAYPRYITPISRVNGQFDAGVVDALKY